MLTFEKIIEPVILLIKEEQNRLKNDEKLYNAPFAHFPNRFGFRQAAMARSKLVSTRSTSPSVRTLMKDKL